MPGSLYESCLFWIDRLNKTLEIREKCIYFLLSDGFLIKERKYLPS